MKKILKGLAGAALGVMLVVGIVRAVGITNPVVNQTALAYSKRFTINLQNAAVNTVSATAVYSSATLATNSFTTGQVSTGSFLVTDNSVLSTAAATNAITVASTSGAVGDSIVVTQLNKPGAFVFLAGRDWNYKATTALTAASIKLALDKVPFFATSRAGAILYSTATTAGANANAIIVQTNNPATLTISSPTFLGGRDATVVTVNGYPFKAGVNFAVGATAADTASNLSTAINAKTTLKDQVTAGTETSSVTVQSDKVGTVYNFTMTSSNSGGIAPLHATLIGGSNGSWTLSSKNISIASHGLTTAYPVLYRLGSGSPVIGGLTGETTYYAIPVSADVVQLATSSAQAQLGVGTTLTSTSTLTAAKTYSLIPLAFTAAATTGGKWQVSNDGSTWSDLSVSSFSWIGGGSVSGSVNWDLGTINYKYLSLNVVGPTTGGLALRVDATGSYTP